jgi:nitric oxide reductase subunit B
MKYASQKVALAYFGVALALFTVQVTVGLVAGWVYVAPNFLSELLPFNILRMLHTNALIVWLLLGFFGAAYYLIPEECETETYSVKLAYLQLVILVVGALGAVIGYVFHIHEGREFLEQPLWVKLGIVVAALIFLFNLTVTVLKGRKTAITNVLLLGFWGIALFFLFALYNPSNLSVDKMYWWYVVHIWVEGVWELVMASVLAFLMLKMTGVDREVVEKWLYAIVALALFSGLLGTGHHYYWIGAPGYWQWIGSIFSSLEILPFFAMVVFCFSMVWKRRREHPNNAALLWSLGCAVLAFFGGGIWGFLHTLHGVNYYTHGTQVTAAHGHLAFFGAYVLLNLTFFYFAIPRIKGFPDGVYDERGGHTGFWLASLGVVGMSLAFAVAGVLQTYLERVQGQPYMLAQRPIRFWMAVAAAHGLLVLAGVVLTVRHLLTLKPAPGAAERPLARPMEQLTPV